MVLKRNRVGQELLIPNPLRDYIPSDHICFFVMDVVDEVDFDKTNEKYLYTAGKAAYPREILASIVILAAIEGIYSSRQIAKQVEENVVYMYVSGRETPSYRTICRFREECAEELEELMSQVIKIAVKEDMVDLKDIAIDSTIIKANASNNTAFTSKELAIAHEIIEKGIYVDKQEDEKYGQSRGDKKYNKKSLKKRTKEIIKEHEKENKPVKKIEYDFTEKEIDKIENTKEVAEKEDKKRHDEKHTKISLSDNDTRFMKNKKDKIEFSYNVQNTVDCRCGIILQTDVNNQPTDHYQLIPQIQKLEKQYGTLEKSHILADNGYFTPKSIEYLYKNNIDGYLPNRAQSTKNRNKNKPYAKQEFKYKINEDYYICPENQKLHLKNTYFISNSYRKVYYTNKCKNCLSKDKCTPGSNYRIISHYQNIYQDKMEQKMNQKENQEIYTKRMNVERPFAHMKQNQNKTQVNHRGLTKVQTEMTTFAISHNIRLIHNKKQNEKQKINTPTTKLKAIA